MMGARGEGGGTGGRGTARACIILCLSAALLCLWAARPAWAAEARRVDPWAKFATVVFQDLKAEDGLPHDAVAALAQDRDGLVWIGTMAGLVRYDGYRLRTYEARFEDPAALPDGYVRALLALPDGSLLVGTNAAGIARFLPTTGGFQRYPVGTGGTAHRKIFALSPARDGGAWIATEHGLARLEADHTTVTQVPLSGTVPMDPAHPRLFTVLEDSAGNLWVGGNPGLAVRRAGHRTFETVAAPAGAPPVVAEMLGNDVWALHEDASGRIWFGTSFAGAGYIDPATLMVHPVPDLSGPDGLPQRSTVRAILEPLPNRLWFATDGWGIAVADMETGERTRLVHDPATDPTLNGNVVRALLMDSAGNVWAGTQRGVERHDTQAVTVRSVYSSPTNPLGLSDPDIYSVATDRRGRIWLGLGQGKLDVLDPRKGEIVRLNLTGLQGGRTVQALVETADGAMLVGSRGIASIDPDSFAITASVLPRFDSVPILSLAIDGDTLIVGTYDGAFRVGLATGDVDSLRHVNGDLSTLASNQVRDILRLPDGRTLFATDGGISLVGPDMKVERNLHHRPDDAGSLPNDYVMALDKDRAGRLWVGTAGGGVAVLTLADLAKPGPVRFHRIGRESGLPGMNVGGIIVDRGGRLWLTVGNRIAYIDGDSLRGGALGARDGAQSHTFTQKAATYTQDGLLLFGGLGGLSVVDPFRLRRNAVRAQLAITGGSIDREPMVPAALPRHGDRLELPRGRRSLTLDFALLDYKARGDVRYAYRMDDLDTAWIASAETLPTATYTNLPAGEHVFRVAATVQGAPLQQGDLVLTVVVPPVWYETWWFKLLLGIVALGLLTGVVQVRTAILRARERNLAAIVAERTRELTDANERLDRLASTDPLTGLLNRRRFLEVADAELKRASRFTHPVSLILLDLDHFKQVNDSRGHQAGDAVLRMVAEAVVGACRSVDIVGRYGGEELLVLVPETAADGAMVAAERIRSAVAAKTVRHEDVTITMTASLGVAEWQGDALDRLLARADAALYAAKRGGRNQVVLAEAAAAL